MSIIKNDPTINTRDIYGMHTLSSNHIAAGNFSSHINIGGETIREDDVAKFRKILGFMEFALGASEELRNLMVAYEAKQRILK